MAKRPERFTIKLADRDPDDLRNLLDEALTRLNRKRRRGRRKVLSKAELNGLAMRRGANMLVRENGQ